MHAKSLVIDQDLPQDFTESIDWIAGGYDIRNELAAPFAASMHGYVEVRCAGEACPIEGTILVTENPRPVLVVPDPGAVCAGGVAVFDISSPGIRTTASRRRPSTSIPAPSKRCGGGWRGVRRFETTSRTFGATTARSGARKASA